jgi:TetR/AcrR family transcriptional regulator, repressor for uid operon
MCFGEQGFDKTTNTDIAQRAGISAPAIYHYFDSKPALFVAVLEREAERTLTSWREAAASADTVLEKLAAILDFGVRATAEGRHRAQFAASVVSEIFRHPEFDAAVASLPSYSKSRGIPLLEEILRQGQARGEVAPDIDVANLSAAIHACISGLTNYGGFVADTQAHREAIGQCKALLAGNVFSVPAASDRSAGTELAAEGQSRASTESESARPPARRLRTRLRRSER